MRDSGALLQVPEAKKNGQTLPNMDPSDQIDIGSLVSMEALLIQPFYSSWDVLKHIEIWTNKEKKR